MIDHIIEQTFREMYSEIKKTKSSSSQPNKYHETSTVSEVNLVYHFVKQLEKKTDNCVVYLEFPCDSGRVDAVVLYENNILFIEAKSKIDNKKYKELDAQARRFENTKDNLAQIDEVEQYDTYIQKYMKDSSLRDTIKDRIYTFMSEKWNLKENINLYGILLAETVSKNEKDKWDHTVNHKHYETYNLNCMDRYTMLDIEEDRSTNQVLWYLGKYMYLGVL